MGLNQSKYMSSSKRDRIHQDMSMLGMKLDILHVIMEENGEDTTKVKADIDRFIKQWKELGLPLKENGKLQEYGIVYAGH